MLGNGPISDAPISGEEPAAELPTPIIPVYRRPRNTDDDDEDTYGRRAGR